MSRRFLFLLTAWVWLFCLHQTAYAQAVSCVDAIARAQSSVEEVPDDFAFLIGKHSVSLHAWRGDDWTPPRTPNAHWHGWYGLQGLAVYDEWHDLGVPGGNLGVNVRLYDPKSGQWKMMWVSSFDRQVKELRAEVIDDVLVMWQVYPARPGWKAEFEVLDEGRWARTSFLQNDAGDWQREFRLVATRISCD